MFAQRVSATAFTDIEVANSSQVKGDNIYDAVFMSVLRAVMPQHIGEDQLYVRYFSTDMSSNAAESNGVDFVHSRLYSGRVSANNSLTFYDLRVQNQINHNMYDGFETAFPGWKRVDRVTAFFKKSFDVVCFVNEEQKSVFLIVGRADVARIHYLLCSLFAWFPWYFNKETGVSADEMALMQSLRKTSPDEFFEILKRFEDKYDFYALRLDALDGFENQWMNRERSNMSESIASLMSEIEIYRRNIADCLKQKEDYEIRVLGLDAAMAKNGSDSEIRDYFVNNKNRLWLVHRDGECLTFEVFSEFIYWDSEAAETLYNNKNSVVYTARGNQPRIRSNEMGELFKAIFIDGTMKLHVCAGYEIDVRHCRVNAISGFEFGTECSNCIPNPHIQIHSCLGGYARALSQMMEHHDYIGCIEQCVVSCQSINLTEHPTIEPFMRSFYSCNSKVIELPDGTMVSPVEAVEFLKKGKEDENEQAD